MKAQLPSNDQEETCRILDHSQSSITPGLGNIADVSRLPEASSPGLCRTIDLRGPVHGTE